MSPLDGMFTGAVLGMLFSLPAFVAEWVHHQKNLPLLVDVKRVWGGVVQPGSVLALSVLLHLLIATAFGGIYPLFVRGGIVPGYDLPFVAVYAFLFFLAVGLALLPSLGLGVFGRREGKGVWLELLISHILFAVCYSYAAVHFFPG